jgi:hypothetical protein
LVIEADLLLSGKRDRPDFLGGWLVIVKSSDDHFAFLFLFFFGNFYVGFGLLFIRQVFIADMQLKFFNLFRIIFT